MLCEPTETTSETVYKWKVDQNDARLLSAQDHSKTTTSACFGSTYSKIGMIQRRLAWPLCKDDMQIPEAFHIFRQPLQ